MKTHDLFPETLLVESEGGRIYTTSLKVAEMAKKRHKNVLQAIDKRIARLDDQEFCRLNFQPAEYRDAQGKPRLAYRLTRDGFAFVFLGFTSKEADDWKVAYIKAFNEAERELAARDRRYVRALAQVRPALIPVVEMTNKGMSRAAIAGPLGKSPASITYHRNRARRLGLLPLAERSAA
ncbi:MAG: Rha family transcriptional regulator [Zoogloeaceae bacterium]|jgi:Rha family phage regulatory protein|nr:Rha family transcriptional regulator [Zoogloeaceae bacterium]